MKTNFEIIQFEDFWKGLSMRFRSKIWKWLKFLNSVPFVKKTLQWMKKKSKITQFSRFLLRSEYAIHVKIWKWQKVLNSFPLIKKTLINHFHIWISSFWLTFTAYSEWRQTSKLVNLKISAKVRVCDFGRTMKMTKTC